MLYVLAIIMIVDGHVGSSDYLDFNGLLRYQNYHIALFMFVSGYFLNLTRGYKEFFARKTLRLLVPLLSLERGLRRPVLVSEPASGLCARRGI